MITLVHYSNRKIYWPGSRRKNRPGRYVNLAEIVGMVRAGRAVRITDFKTGDDLTPRILAMALVRYGGPSSIKRLRRALRATDAAA